MLRRGILWSLIGIAGLLAYYAHSTRERDAHEAAYDSRADRQEGDPDGPGLEPAATRTNGAGPHFDPAVANPGTPVTDGSPTRDLRISGIAYDDRGNRVPLVVVAHGARCPHHFRTVQAGRDGTFALDLAVPAGCDEVLVTGHLDEGGKTQVAYPQRLSVTPAVSSLGCVLLVRGAGRLQGRSEVSGANTTGGTLVLVSQVPHSDPQPYEGWNAEAWVTLSKLVSPAADGSFSVCIRPGGFRVRLLSRSGTLGPAVHGVIEAGQTIDVGTLGVPGPGVACVLRVMGDDQRPLAGASIQLSDPDLALMDAEGNGESPHFVTDVSGLVRLPAVDLRALPLSGAVWAKGFAPTRFDLPAQGGEVEVTLRRLARLLIRLGGPLQRADPLILQSVKVRMGTSGPVSETPDGEALPPLEILKTLAWIAGPDKEVLPGTRATLSTSLPPPGVYRVWLELGSSPLAGGTVVVAEHANPNEDVVIDLEPSPGRIVSIEVALPEALATSITAKHLYLTLRAGAEDPGAVVLRTADFISGAPTPVWVPADKYEVSVGTRQRGLFPIRAATMLIRGDHLKIVLAPGEGSGDLSVRMVGPEGERLESAWPIVIRGPLGEHGRGRIVSGRTAGDGTLSVKLLAGEYELRTGRSFVHPYARKLVRVQAGATTAVAFSLLSEE